VIVIGAGIGRLATAGALPNPLGVPTFWSGQGISSAGHQAGVLQKLAQRIAMEPDPALRLQAGFIVRVSSALETSWAMPAGVNLAFPRTRRSTRKFR
jgi:hypothetical protein